MTNQKGPEGKQSFTIEEVGADEDEHDGEGHGQDDFGVDDRNLVDILDECTEAFLAVEDADGTEGTDEGGEQRGNDGDDQGIA